MATTKKEKDVFDIAKIKPADLPELANFKKKQTQALKDFPFVKIIDSKTYDQAKKNRTGLLTCRTDIEKQEKLIASKLKTVRELISSESEKLIEITKSSEEAQQTEVRRYEAEKEAERQEKIRIEAERIKAIELDLQIRHDVAQSKIESMTFESIPDIGKWIEEAGEIDTTVFAELSPRFDSDIIFINNYFEKTKKQLEEKEAQRVKNAELQAEADRLKAENEALAKKNKEIADKAEAEAKELREKNAKLEADKRKADQKILDDKKAEADRIEAKRKADQKILDDKKKAEQKIIDDKAEADRIKALRPDKEKAIEFFEGVIYSIPNLGSKDPALNQIILDFINKIDEIKVEAITQITKY